MKNNEAQILIQKFLRNTAAQSDLDKLEHWLEKKENRDLFNSMVQANYTADYNLSDFKIEEEKSTSEKNKSRQEMERTTAFQFSAKICSYFYSFPWVGVFFPRWVEHFPRSRQANPCQ